MMRFASASYTFAICSPVAGGNSRKMLGLPYTSRKASHPWTACILSTIRNMQAKSIGRASRTMMRSFSISSSELKVTSAFALYIHGPRRTGRARHHGSMTSHRMRCILPVISSAATPRKSAMPRCTSASSRFSTALNTVCRYACCSSAFRARSASSPIASASVRIAQGISASARWRLSSTVISVSSVSSSCSHTRCTSASSPRRQASYSSTARCGVSQGSSLRCSRCVRISSASPATFTCLPVRANKCRAA